MLLLLHGQPWGGRGWGAGDLLPGASWYEEGIAVLLVVLLVAI